MACFPEHISLKWAQEKGTGAEDLEEGTVLLDIGEALPSTKGGLRVLSLYQETYLDILTLVSLLVLTPSVGQQGLARPLCLLGQTLRWTSECL